MGSSASGQMLDPVEWSFKKEKLGKGNYKLHLKADLDEGWHLYSQDLPKDATPLPTVIEFEDNAQLILKGETKEHGVVTEADPVSGNELSFFKEKAHFTQKVRVKGSGTEKVKGKVEYMVCDDSRCLPPSGKDFSFELKGGGASKSNEKEEKKEGKASVQDTGNNKEPKRAPAPEMADPVEWRSKVIELGEARYVLQLKADIDSGWHIYGRNLKGSGPVPTRVEFQAGQGQKLIGKLWETKAKEKFDKQFQSQVSYYEQEAVFEQVVKVKKTKKADSAKAEVEYMCCTDMKCLKPKTIVRSFSLDEAAKGEARLVEEDELKKRAEKKADDASSEEKESRGLLLTFIFSFGGGFLALLTPCVFPMIPLTVSFFTKQSKNRAEGIENALIYSTSIVVIYTTVGYLVTLIFGGSAMNAISTNPWVNIFIFAFIVIFAISFLGAFDLTLPDSWINRSDKMADKGGVIGIFFMAFVLSLVSFSCTAPIIGPLLFQTASQGGFAPAVGMAGFSLALALPFGLFAGFPAWLNSLPQSGGWMNTVKVTLGFLELALAFKFLSNADLVTQAGLLKRELFLAIMIGIFAIMSMYLLGLFRTPNDDEVPKLSVPRILIATLSLVFTLYLIPGLFGAPLKLISGFPPPLHYSEWSKGGLMGSESGHSRAKKANVDWGENCPQGLNCFNDYEKALTYAKKVDKPLMLDFTGHACANCRRMEATVWTEEGIMKMLQKDVVIASLYVDERSDLPKKEQKTVELNGEKMELETVGDKWQYFQAKNYGNNSQPYYVLLDHQEEKLVEPTGYEPNAREFASWLKKGIEKFEGNP
ncbi:MAG: protein-disulfide reductase DsbD domain-containing protein [Flavobacteriales bacterium]